MNVSLAQRHGRRVFLRALSLPLALAAIDGSVLAAAKSKPVTHTVIIDGMRFEPAALTVAPGDRVVWVNKDPFPHTATAAGVFDSGSIASARSWTWTARTKGEHAYLCTLHTTMKASLTVR